jgi:N-acetylglutamate synthase-like GNAT family acetyltransferase
MEIKHILKHPQAIPVIARWLENEWGHLSPDVNFSKISSDLRKQKIHHNIPETFIAVENNKFLGTASLVGNDMSTRPELTPWLAGVFVDPIFRNNGVGAELVKTVVAEAEIIGIKKFYLWTANKMNYYSNLGWQFFEQTNYLKKNVTIMSYEF